MHGELSLLRILKLEKWSVGTCADTIERRGYYNITHAYGLSDGVNNVSPTL